MKYARSVAMATEVNLDEMRTLLELHYDDIHVQSYRNKTRPKRKRDYKLQNSVLRCSRTQNNERLSLPATFKSIFLKPEHESNPKKLAEFRNLLTRLAQGEATLLLTREDADAVAESLEANRASTLSNELGSAVKGIPEGALVQTPAVPKGRRSVADDRALLADRVRESDAIVVLTRPFTNNAVKPLLDKFGCAIVKTTKSLKAIANESNIADPDIFDNLLIVLWDVLFTQKSLDWTRRGFGNTSASDSLEYARWFIKGLCVGSTTIFDGICSMCGTLLHGDPNRNQNGHECNRSYSRHVETTKTFLH